MSTVGIGCLAVVSAAPLIPIFDFKPSGRELYTSGSALSDDPSGFNSDHSIRRIEFLLSGRMFRYHGHGQRMRSMLTV